MANILKKSLNLLLCLALVLSMMSAVTLTAAAENTTTALLLDKSYAKIDLGETLELKAVLNANDTYSVPKVTWRSSEEDVATVSNGTVTPVAPGTTRIIAITADGITAECLVDVANDDRLYFEERVIYTTAGTAIEYNLMGNLAESASLSYRGFKRSNSTDPTAITTGVTLDEDNSTFKAATKGVYEIIATAEDNGETLIAKCLVTVDDTGLAATVHAELAKADVSGQQTLWKYGYMTKDDPNSFSEYNNVWENGLRYGESNNNYGYARFLQGGTWWPGKLYSSVMVWTAPKNGTVTVDRGPQNNMYGVKIGFAESVGGTTVSGTTDTYYSLDFQIFHNEDELFKTTYEAEQDATDASKYQAVTTKYESGKTDDLSAASALQNISVKKGDEIFFVVSRNQPDIMTYTTLNFVGFRVKYSEETPFTETETSFSITEDTVSLGVGGEKTLTTTDVATYVSSNTTIATVENGTVTAVGEGEAVIYALNADGTLADYCTVTVANWGVPTISDGTVSIEAKSETVKNSAVIVAVKNGSGVLQKAYIAEYADADNKFTASNVAVASGDSVAVFLWESMNTLKPLKAAIPVATE